MKDLVDKSMGIVTLIPEDLVKIRPTESSRLVKRAARKKTKLFRFLSIIPLVILR
jgi:hypothetical protein